MLSAGEKKNYTPFTLTLETGEKNLFNYLLQFMYNHTESKNRCLKVFSFIYIDFKSRY